MCGSASLFQRNIRMEDSEAFVWKIMVELWKLLDSTVNKYAGSVQFFKTASAGIDNGAIVVEAGAPESSFQFYSTHCGVGNARYLYDVVRNRTSNAGRDDPTANVDGGYLEGRDVER